VHLGSEPAEVGTAENAVRLPLRSGWVTTAWGAEIHRVVAAAEASGGPVSRGRMPA
jgi:urease accessory protein